MLGRRIAMLRKEKELSQYELADRLGFSRGKIANYEQESRQPDYDTLIKIAEFFEVTTDYLLGKTDFRDGTAHTSEDTDDNDIEKLIDDPQLGMWYKELKGSPEENRQKALDFLRYLNEQEKGRKPGDKQK